MFPLWRFIIKGTFSFPYSVMISTKIQIISVDGKGMGVVATEEIHAGELLISEEPLLFLKHWSPDYLLEQWSNLENQSKVDFLNLANAHKGKIPSKSFNNATVQFRCQSPCGNLFDQHASHIQRWRTVWSVQACVQSQPFLFS